MKNSRMQQIRGFNDPRLGVFVKRMTTLLVLAATKAAAHTSDPSRFPLPDNEQSLEHVFLKRLRSLNDKKQRAARESALHLVDAPMDLKRKLFSNLADLNFGSKEPLAIQMQSIPPDAGLKQAVLDVKSIRDLFKPYLPPSVTEVGSSGASHSNPGGVVLTTVFRPTSSPLPSQLEFFVSLRRLFCADETGTEPFGEIGEDEIALGGSAIDAVGRITRLETLRVKNDQGNDFEDGGSKTFSPPKGYAAFNLNDGLVQPKWVFVLFTLAELDEGGFADFLNELYSHVRDQIIKEFANAGFDVGGSIAGPPGAIVGAIVGAAIGFAVRELVQWIINAWNDDIFPPQMIGIELNGFIPEDSLSDGYQDPDPVHFYGHDGHYMLWLNNKLVAGLVT